MMNILVVGSTGPQGREFVAQALAAGHSVRALARKPSALQSVQGLEVVRGDVFDQPSLDAAARGQDAAVVMLGISLAAARKPTNVFSQGTRNLIAALKPAGVRRLIVQSSFGVGDSRRHAGLPERVIYALLLRGAYADKEFQEQAVRESTLDYTIVRPTRLTMGPGTGATPPASTLAALRATAADAAWVRRPARRAGLIRAGRGIARGLV